MRRPLFALGIAIACAAGVSCATKTELSGRLEIRLTGDTPDEPDTRDRGRENDIKRRSFEDGFAAALGEHGIDAVPSYRILPNPERLSKDSIQQAIRGRGIQGVLVTRLVQVDEREKYVPPTTYVQPGYYGRGLYGYYGRGYESSTSPVTRSTRPS